MIHNDLTYIEGVFSRCQCKGKISSDILLLTHEYIANKGNSHESLCMYQSRDLAFSKPIAAMHVLTSVTNGVRIFGNVYKSNMRFGR